VHTVFLQYRARAFAFFGDHLGFTPLDGYLFTGICVFNEAQARKLPKYPVVPATLLGRLATEQNYRGLGLGEHLLMDTLHRAFIATSQIASYAVVVDPKDDSAKAFYKKYDFTQFHDHPNRLFLPMNKIRTLFS
jgi:predicted GNAT family N-acyltransferase